MPALPWFQIIIAIYVGWVIAAVVTLLSKRRSPTATLAWIFAFVALPFVSGLYYLVFGPRRLHRRRRRYGVARSVAAAVSEHLRKTCGTRRPALSEDAVALAGVGKRLGQGEPTLRRGGAALRQRRREARGARPGHRGRAPPRAPRVLHLGAGRRRNAFPRSPRRRGGTRRGGARAGRRGRLAGAERAHSGSRSCDAGGEVLRFNPVRLSIASLNFANFRTHRKIAVIDGAVGFLGGVNLHDPASATRSGTEAWRDEHARIDGEPVRKIQRLFLENWTYAGGRFRMSPQSVPSYFPPVLPCAPGVPVQILASGPDDETAPLLQFFLAALATARSRAWIETPYLIPDEPLEAALRVAALRGVDVQVIVPKQGDSRLVTAASHTYCESLAKAGIVMFEYGPPMLHAKTIVVDDTMALVGTANLDNRSFRLNFEIAAAFYDQAVIDKLARRFEQDRAVSRPFSARKRNPRLTVLLESIARLTSPVL